jgi:hypothetical protein
MRRTRNRICAKVWRCCRTDFALFSPKFPLLTPPPFGATLTPKETVNVRNTEKFKLFFFFFLGHSFFAPSFFLGSILKRENVGFLSSLHSSVLPGLYSECNFFFFFFFSDFVLGGAADSGCGCVFLSAARSGGLFPDLHECGKLSDFVGVVRQNSVAAPLAKVVAQCLSAASDCEQKKNLS